MQVYSWPGICIFEQMSQMTRASGRVGKGTGCLLIGFGRCCNVDNTTDTPSSPLNGEVGGRPVSVTLIEINRHTLAVNRRPAFTRQSLVLRPFRLNASGDLVGEGAARINTRAGTLYVTTQDPQNEVACRWRNVAYWDMPFKRQTQGWFEGQGNSYRTRLLWPHAVSRQTLLI